MGFHVMKRHGFAHNSHVVKTFHKMMKRHVRIIRKIRHVKKIHHTRTVTRHHRTVTITRHHYSFRSSHTTHKVVRHLVKKVGSKKALHTLMKIYKGTRTAVAKKNLRKAIKLVKKQIKKGK